MTQIETINVKFEHQVLILGISLSSLSSVYRASNYALHTERKRSQGGGHFRPGTH